MADPSAAMVQAKVVKGAGAGTMASLDCSAVLAMFDPEITFGSHSSMQGSLAHVESHDASAGRGYQSEHVPPRSVCRGLPGYSVDGAMTWMAHDGQLAGREHKILTDAMRQFSQSNGLPPPGRQATLSEWIDQYQQAAQKALTEADPKRAIRQPHQYDEASLIAAAAACIANAARASFPASSLSTPLPNPPAWSATKAQVAAATIAVGSAVMSVV